MDYKKILIAAHELESLAIHAVAGETVPAELPSLIKVKIAELTALAETHCDDPKTGEAMADAAIFEDEQDAGVSFQYEYADEEDRSDEQPCDDCDEEDEYPDAADYDEEAEDDAEPDTIVSTSFPVMHNFDFTINDRFRFKRELFNDNKENFEQSLALVSTMGTFAQAEDYFYNDLQLDPVDPSVEAFMTIIARGFK